MRTGALSFAMLVASFPCAALSQQVAATDLKITPLVEQTEAGSKKRDMPGGCKELTERGIADGWISPEDHKVRKISISVVSVSNSSPQEGETVEAVVRLRNGGKQAIQIPWSKDPGPAAAGQDASHRFRENGTFEVELGSRKNSGRSYRLVSQTAWLYGSTSAPDTVLELRPGQWIVATIEFKVVNRYFPQDGLPAGPARLFVRWHQVHNTWDVKDCQRTIGYFYYTGPLGSFYKQTNPGFEIRIRPRKIR